MIIIKHSFPIMVAHSTTTIYIIVIEVSCMCLKFLAYKYIFLKFYHSLSPSRGFESQGQL